MNGSAIVAHNIMSPQDKQFPTLVGLDVGCTGAAALCAAVAALASRQHQKAATKGLRQRAASNVAVWSLAAVAASVISIAVAANTTHEVAWANEMIYIGLAVACTPLVAAYLAGAWRLGGAASRWGSCLAVGGLMLGGAGVTLDPSLCRLAGSHFTHAHVLFLGCDLIYLGLLLHLVALPPAQQ
ncbi:uncharacterized protein HaLaN_08455 [Haematococcus lacustris]|uniref:Uncharacterized protein n=1 Tax=Haematococcus lacustris TaxID=44745 RepID=A0A699Z0E5_HAELA|nr:uncharacterized protein HaLaN_08455 [Haematococcus lacustris]